MFKLIIRAIKNLFSKSTIKDDSKAQKRNKTMFRIGFFLIALQSWFSFMKKWFYVCWGTGFFGRLVAILSLVFFMLFAFFTYRMAMELINY